MDPARRFWRSIPMTNDDRSRRRHYAVALTKVNAGWMVVASLPYRSRAEADKGSLRLMASHEHTAAITLYRELGDGEVLDAETMLQH
jgi:hypothetical protein